MAIGLNKDVLKRIVETLGLQSSVEKLPTEVIPTIQPVLIANPERIVDINKSSFRTATSIETLYTTPTDRDFYLTTAYLSNQSDATADNVTVVLNITLDDGSTDEIILLGKLTTTAFNKAISRSFDVPIKIKRGTTITFGTGFTAGTSITTAGITGYTVD